MNKVNGWILKTLVTFLLTGLMTIMLFIGRNVIANDKDSRARDIVQMEKHNEAMLEQSKINGEATLALTRSLLAQNTINGKLDTTLQLIQNDLKHMKKDVQ